MSTPTSNVQQIAACFGVDDIVIRRLQARGYLRTFGLTQVEVRRRVYAAHLVHCLAGPEPRRRKLARPL